MGQLMSADTPSTHNESPVPVTGLTPVVAQCEHCAPYPCSHRADKQMGGAS